jgi:hypothetical protein
LTEKVSTPCERKLFLMIFFSIKLFQLLIAFFAAVALHCSNDVMMLIAGKNEIIVDIFLFINFQMYISKISLFASSTIIFVLKLSFMYVEDLCVTFFI